MGFNLMKNGNNDIIELLINKSYELKVKKFGDSFYLHIPADLAKRLGLKKECGTKKECYVRVIILGVYEEVRDTEEVV